MVVVDCSMEIQRSASRRVHAFNAINNFNVLSNVLICAICNKWLSPPIFSSSVGVHICGSCNRESEEPLTTRNGKLQYFLADKFFPCKFFAEGCSMVALRKDLQQHEAECETRRQSPFSYCCICDFRTIDKTLMYSHYIDVHHVTTDITDATSYTLKKDVKMQFVQNGINTFAIRCVKHTTSNSYSILVCEPFGMLPQFEYELKHRRYLYLSGQIGTTWNQLRWPNNELMFDFDWRESLQIYFCSACKDYGCKCKSSNGVECTYAFRKCCQLSLFADEHFEHIMLEHKPSQCALIDRKLLKNAGTQYVYLDGNIFRLTIDAIGLLYWFAGDYKYTYYVSCGKDELFLEMDEHKLHKSVQGLPENWKKIYIARKDQ